MNYSKIATSTAKKIKKNGKAIALRKESGLTTFDPVLGKKVPVYDPDEKGYALEVQYDVKEGREGWLIDGVKKLMCVGITNPSPGDLLHMQSIDFSIVHVKPFSPADVVIYYEVFIK